MSRSWVDGVGRANRVPSRGNGTSTWRAAGWLSWGEIHSKGHREYSCQTQDLSTLARVTKKSQGSVFGVQHHSWGSARLLNSTLKPGVAWVWALPHREGTNHTPALGSSVPAQVRRELAAVTLLHCFPGPLTSFSDPSLVRSTGLTHPNSGSRSPVWTHARSHTRTREGDKHSPSPLLRLRSV
jgi:hypothetical protein